MLPCDMVTQEPTVILAQRGPHPLMPSKGGEGVLSSISTLPQENTGEVGRKNAVERREERGLLMSDTGAL